MIDHKLIEKPSVFGGLAALLWLLASTSIHFFVDKSGSVTLSKELLLQAVGLAITLFVVTIQVAAKHLRNLSL